MTEDQKKSRSDDLRRNREAGSDPLEGTTEIPAIHHIGKTLESDPEYYAVVAPGHSTPEAQIAAEAGPVDVDQRRMEEDDFDPSRGEFSRTGRNRSERGCQGTPVLTHILTLAPTTRQISRSARMPRIVRELIGDRISV